jgi:hypothetical protein
MNLTVKRVAAVAALGAAMGVAAPVASASAAIPPAAGAGLALPFPDFPGAGLPGFAAGFGFDPVPGLADEGVGAATVVGPVIITNGTGVSFINTNNQVTAGSAVSGGQVTGP